MQPLTLPVDNHEWLIHFEKFFRRLPEVQNAYDFSQSCVIELSAEELGAFSLVCEREFLPLRWAVRRSGDSYTITLIDDRGSETPSRVSRYTFEAPDSRIKLESFIRTYGVH
ncbi:MAG: hypothetical protein ACREX3_23000, partial [Gammaproteobacteria bacterium]